MAGPYYIASYVPERHLLLRRNPNYHGPRPAEMREIDIDLAVASTRAVAAVESGSADYTSNVPFDRVGTLERDYGPDSDAGRAGRQRYFSSPAPILNVFVMNTRRSLFAGTRMRRALNFALDRRALAREVPADRVTAPGRPTDQFIPPGLPGFQDATIYPLGGPDLERARRLAGDRRHRAVLYACSRPACAKQAGIARRNLAEIGIDVDVKLFPFAEFFRRLAAPR